MHRRTKCNCIDVCLVYCSNASSNNVFNAQEAIQFTCLIYRFGLWRQQQNNGRSNGNHITYDQILTILTMYNVQSMFKMEISQNRQYFKTVRIQIKFSTHHIDNRNKELKESVDMKFLGQFTMTTGYGIFVNIWSPDFS